MNEQERFFFDLRGYLVVENALSPEQLATLNGLLDAAIHAGMGPEVKTKRFNPMIWGQPCVDLLANLRITPYLSEMLGDDFRLDHVYVDVIRAGLGPIGATLHGGATPYDPAQYYVFRNGKMHNGLSVVAYNLRDVGEGDGGFGCIPGSHKSNYPAPKDWLNLEKPVPCVQAVTGKAGSAILFTEALTHGTLPWRGADERRTLFVKYSPKHMAYLRNYVTEDGLPELTDEQRRMLRTPGISPQ